MEKTAINTSVKDFNDVQRALEAVKTELDLVKEKLNPISEDEEDTSGTPGSIRIIKNTEAENLFEIKTEDGWKKPMMGESQVTLKNLVSNTRAPEKKSIDELATNDSNTGKNIANKTIFDEKAGKFVLPRPDYDSGWVQLDKNTTITLTHNLELDTIPSLMKSYISTIATPVVGTNPIFECLQLNENNGFFIEIATSNTLKAHSGANGTFDPSTFGDLTNSDDIDDGYIRVLLWK